MLLLLAAGAAQAQERPDYSSNGLLRLFADQPEQTEQRPIRRFGYVDIRALGDDYRFHYIPRLMMPLSGTELDVTNTWPDPFSLTGTQIATSKRAWRTQRAVNAEMRRIEKMERARLRIATR